MSRIRVLLVDDAVVVRRIVPEELGKDPEIEVVGVAANGAIALTKIQQLEPDIVLLDIEMPVMDGLQTLGHLRKTHPRLPVIMFSTLTERGACATLDALALGASDYLTKPSNVGLGDAREKVRDDLVAKIKHLVHRRLPGAAVLPRALGNPRSPTTRPPSPTPRPVKSPSVGAAASRPESAAVFATVGLPANPTAVTRSPSSPSVFGLERRRLDVMVIGVSTGGPNALAELIPALPGTFPVPILIVQHMPPLFTKLLAERLDARSSLRVVEASNGLVVEPGRVYLAPGDYHLGVRRDGTVVRTVIQQGPPENHCRPAVDVLFRDAAEVYGAGTLGVILTGMGQDGLLGCDRLRVVGGQVLAQDEPSSVVWGMPGAVSRAGLAHAILPLSGMVGEVLRRVGTARPAAVALVIGRERGRHGVGGSIMALAQTDFDYIRSLAKEQAAIDLGDDKGYLVEARLGGLARQIGCPSVGELVQRLRGPAQIELRRRVVEALTTNETSFFRDVKPFETLRRIILPDIFTRRASLRQLRIWSAASSTGQEPYSIAMMLHQEFPANRNWNIQLLATDLSREVLENAKRGRYSQLEVNRGLPAKLLVNCFTECGRGEWQLKEEVRNLVQFQQMNLIGAWPPMPKQDVIFLRNVLIYFNSDTRKMILGRIKTVLAPDGYLFLGGAETTINLDAGFFRHDLGGTSCYRLCA